MFKVRLIKPGEAFVQWPSHLHETKLQDFLFTFQDEFWQLYNNFTGP